MPVQPLPSAAAPSRAEPRPAETEIRVKLPAVTSPQGYDAHRDDFLRTTRPFGDAVRRTVGGHSNVLALLAGSRVAVFRELDVDGLVMVDWSRPGTDAQIRQAFAAPQALLRSVRDGIAAGNDTSDVLAAPAAAEILLKLGIDLGVNEVRVGRFALPGKPVSFASQIVELSDPPSVMVFDFAFQGRARCIAFVSWRLHGEDGGGRSPLPDGLLRLLMPRGPSWVYAAADGLAVFSRDQANGLQGTSRSLVDGLTPGGAVIVDDPRNPAYLNGGQDSDGIGFLRGRAPLESFGLRGVAAIPVKALVYGYAGTRPDDRVRIAMKPGRPSQGAQPGPIALDGLTPLGWTRFRFDR